MSAELDRHQAGKDITMSASTSADAEFGDRLGKIEEEMQILLRDLYEGLPNVTRLSNVQSIFEDVQNRTKKIEELQELNRRDVLRLERDLGTVRGSQQESQVQSEDEPDSAA